jgi:hypothetical protein
MNLSEYASASSSSPRSAHHGVVGVEQQRRSLSSRSSLVGTIGQQQQRQQQQRSSSSRARAAAPSSGRRMRRIRPRPLAPPWRRRFLPWLLALLGVFIAAAIVYWALTAAAAVSRDRTAAVHSLRSAGGPHTTLKELNELRRREGRLAAELRRERKADAQLLRRAVDEERRTVARAVRDLITVEGGSAAKRDLNKIVARASLSGRTRNFPQQPQGRVAKRSAMLAASTAQKLAELERKTRAFRSSVTAAGKSVHSLQLEEDVSMHDDDLEDDSPSLFAHRR